MQHIVSITITLLLSSLCGAALVSLVIMICSLLFLLGLLAIQNSTLCLGIPTQLLEPRTHTTSGHESLQISRDLILPLNASLVPFQLTNISTPQGNGPRPWPPNNQWPFSEVLTYHSGKFKVTFSNPDNFIDTWERRHVLDTIYETVQNSKPQAPWPTRTRLDLPNQRFAHGYNYIPQSWGTYQAEFHGERIPSRDVEEVVGRICEMFAVNGNYEAVGRHPPRGMDADFSWFHGGHWIMVAYIRIRLLPPPATAPEPVPPLPFRLNLAGLTGRQTYTVLFRDNPDKPLGPGRVYIYPRYGRAELWTALDHILSQIQHKDPRAHVSETFRGQTPSTHIGYSLKPVHADVTYGLMVHLLHTLLAVTKRYGAFLTHADLVAHGTSWVEINL